MEEKKSFKQNPDDFFDIELDVKSIKGVDASYDAKLADEAPRIVQLVIKYSGGLIKNQSQAEYVLFGFVVTIIIISFSLFFSGEKQKSIEGADIDYEIRQ